MMRMSIGLVAATCLVTGCSFGQRDVGDLSEQELAAFTALETRLDANTRSVRTALATLGELGVEYIQVSHALDTELARSGRLDALQGPWDDSAAGAGVRALVLHQLYALETAEDELLAARVRERRGGARSVESAYVELSRLTEAASRGVARIIDHLNQPLPEQLSARSGVLLEEVTAFRSRLEGADEARLRDLAADVAHHEERARRVREQVDSAIEVIVDRGGD